MLFSEHRINKECNKMSVARMIVSLPMPDCHTFVSYFRVFQMSTIPRVFGQQLWKLAVSLILTCSFSWWGSFGWWNNYKLPFLHKVYFIFIFHFLHRLVFHDEFFYHFKMRANSPFLRPSKTFGTDFYLFSFTALKKLHPV